MQIDTMTIDNEANTTLTVYLHEEKPEFHRIDKRPFILVIPGGGYGFCSEREAEPIALKFAAEGYHAGVLRYHVGEHRDFHKALTDAEKSMDLIALLAEKAKIDQTKIAVIGFSAGGHLAAALSTLSDQKPSACILAYPAILSSFAEAMKIQAPSLEMCVTPQTPPTFLFSTFEDNVVPIENSLLYLRALEENNVPFETHIFQKGKHGLSLGNKWSGNSEEMVDPRFAKWFELCIEWLEIIWVQAAAETTQKIEDIWQVPIKNLYAIEANQSILLEHLPFLADRSRFKIIRSLSFNQLCEVSPDKFPKTKISQWVNELTWYR